MAITAGAGVDLGLSRSPFLPRFKKMPPNRSPFISRIARRAKPPLAAMGAADLLAEVARYVDPLLGVGVGLPCTVMECGDIIYRSTLPRQSGLTITAPGVALALAAASYLWATPGVAPGFFDMFFLAFVERLFRPSYRKDDFVLGKKLGEGAFGVVYRASIAKSKPSAPKLMKQGDLVLKKATEYGAVEIWMNERVRRACASSCADFVYGFQESSAKGKGRGEYWLIWRFEGVDTLSELLTNKEFPYNVSNSF
ncbi:serine/threonine-protein kinase STN7, chloroplastic-like isoform X1 [Phalaenopsis equestris]|uniref:serine/threonine-protein kinase STN7, chloroplastic-like isoform X1 n=2 Tax=Phalaenopsis equestris TaxID=78828 RepID=UPI0009E553D3|nr:serine/threonine-protein kinase STN7, chloroplastic-like isoform X1 [Phalaenopsis equestris]